MIFLFAVCPVCDAGRKGFFDRDSAEGSTACDVWWSTFASCHHLISPKNFGKVLAWLIVSHMFHLDSNRLVFLGWVETTNQLFRLFHLVLRQSLFVFLQCRLCRTRTQVRPAAKLAGRPDTPSSLTTIDSDKWLKSVERLTTGNKLHFFYSLAVQYVQFARFHIAIWYVRTPGRVLDWADPSMSLFNWSLDHSFLVLRWVLRFVAGVNQLRMRLHIDVASLEVPACSSSFRRQSFDLSSLFSTWGLLWRAVQWADVHSSFCI